MLAAIGITFAYMQYSKNLPELSILSDYQPPLVSRVYNTGGELIAEYADEHRILTPFREFPKRLVHAFLAAEDQQFFEHPGINPARIFSAAIANIKAGHTVQGGSTITQQVAKNFLLTSERSYTRKIREVILAYRIEKAFSKEDILYLYLNQIYLGRGSYGVASAAWRYFHKRLDELSLAECATLAGLPKAPSKYAPHLHPDLARKRRNTVLQLMQKSGFAKAGAVAAALREAVVVTPLEAPKLINAYADQVNRQLIEQFGLETLRRQGLTIIAPYNQEAELAAIKAVRHGVLDIERRQKYRYPTNHAPDEWPALLAGWARARAGKPAEPADDELIPALVENVLDDGGLIVNDGVSQWRLKKPRWKWEPAPETEPGQEPEPIAQRPRHWIPGDEVRLQGAGDDGVRLMQEPSVESALYAIDLERGTVLARVGGYDYQPSGFDRVRQALRQPGSSFKPLLYATAMGSGLTPASIIMDTPVVFENQKANQFWRPENYRDRFVGPVTLRNALEHSRNLASIKVLQNVGIKRFLSALKNYPLQRDFPPQLSLALGATEVKPEALTESYMVLASGGERWKPVAIQQVQDRTGNTLFRSVSGNRCRACHVNPVMSANKAMQPGRQAVDPVDAFLVTNMMKGVIERGTGRRARALHRPAAGKTGTTNKQVDAWFMGFTPQILTGVWSGRDQPSPMGRHETGSHAALPAWLEAMQAFHKGKPVKDFVPPEGIEWVAIDQKSGELPGPDTRHIFLEAFREGTAPTKRAPARTEEHPDKNRGFFDLGI